MKLRSIRMGLALAAAGLMTLPALPAAASAHAPKAPAAPMASVAASVPAAPRVAEAPPMPPSFEVDGDGPLAMGMLDEDGEGSEMAPFDGPDMAPHGGPGAGRRLRAGGAMRREALEALQLTREQQSRIADLRERRHRAAIEARADLQIAALDLRKLMREEHPDRGAIEAQIDRISQRRAELRKTQVSSMLEVRQVLTAEQRDLLRQKRVVVRDRLRDARDVRREVIRLRGGRDVRREVIRIPRHNRGGHGWGESL